MAVKIPEFILSSMFVRGSLKTTEAGFVFSLKNSYAPATIHGFDLEIDGEGVARGDLSLELEGGAGPVNAADLSADVPFALPVDTLLRVTVQGSDPGDGRLRIHVETREVGLLSFSVKTEADSGKGARWPRHAWITRLLGASVAGRAEVDWQSVIGEIRDDVYGHFVEHLEGCVYGGIWDEDGNLQPDVVDLVRRIGPTVIRYPGGNFASDYHWEEGVGPRAERRPHYNRAWHVEDTNLVGTDEFLAFCEAVGAKPFLVVNDGSGTPEEAARWVEYCNGPVSTPMGALRAKNGHPEPYNVRIWGLGNEVWGEWQIGHTDAAGYVARIVPFIEAMRAVDPDIRLVAVGLDQLDGDPRDAEQWNATVLRGLGDGINDLSFHVYQPSEEGYQPFYDPDQLYRQIVAAPLSVEDAVNRMASHMAELRPGHSVGIVLDEWNVKLPPPPGAKTMHEQEYTMRDALYVAAMLNVFHRTCNALTMANLAMLVNVLPAITKAAGTPASFTPLAYPFVLYRAMEKLAVRVAVTGGAFHAPALGLNIDEKRDVPWLDATATRDADGRRLVVALVNRHPTRRMRSRLLLKGAPRMKARQCRELVARGPLSREPRLRTVAPPHLRGREMTTTLPPASVTVVELEKE